MNEKEWRMGLYIYIGVAFIFVLGLYLFFVNYIQMKNNTLKEPIQRKECFDADIAKIGSVASKKTLYISKSYNRIH